MTHWLSVNSIYLEDKRLYKKIKFIIPIHLTLTGIYGIFVLLSNVLHINPETLLYLLSLILIIHFIWYAISWYFIIGNILDPYILFIASTFIFNGSLALLYLFGKEYSETLNTNHSTEIIVSSLFFITISTSAFHFGGILGQTTKRESDLLGGRLDIRKVNIQEEAMRIVGWSMLIVAILPFLLFIKEQIAIVDISGRFGMFRVSPATGFGKWNQVLSGYYLPGIFFLLLGGRKRRTYRLISLVLLLVYVILYLYIGDRSIALFPVVVYLWLWFKYIGKPEWRKITLLVIISAIIMFIVIPTIQVVRNVPGNFRKGISAYLRGFKEVKNPFIAPFTEMGGTLNTIIYTIEYIPSKKNYGYGSSYLYALTTIFPNIFWKVHPATARGTYSEWLVNCVNPGYAAKGGGYGFSYIAEAYANFGLIGGIVFMIILGFFISRLTTKVETEVNIIMVGFFASFLAQLLYFARCESTFLIREIAWYSFAPYLIALSLFKKKVKYY